MSGKFLSFMMNWFRKRMLPSANPMSASPFQTPSGPFVEIPAPFASDAAVSPVKKELENVPFKAEVHEFPAPEFELEKEDENSPRRRSFLAKMFKRHTQRRLREEMLTAELKDLRSSYAGLLLSTEEIREQLEEERGRHKEITQVLSPFPGAIENIEVVKTRQEEASEILTTIRERLDKASDRDSSLLESMDQVHGGIVSLTTGVGTVNAGMQEVAKNVSEVAAGQASAQAVIGDFGVKMEKRFEKAAELARKNAERVEQSSDDVLLVLKQMERNSQRGLWIFAILLAVLFFILIGFSAKMSQLGSKAEGSPATGAASESQTTSEQGLLVSEPAAEVLVDEFEF